MVGIRQQYKYLYNGDRWVEIEDGFTLSPVYIIYIDERII
jgi:hypothetical protein